MFDRNHIQLSYRYGFNSMEENEELGHGLDYDLGARMYNSKLGRMFSPDPWEYKYAWQSTYAYYRNSPISTIDYLGKGESKEISGEDLKTIIDDVKKKSPNAKTGALIIQIFAAIGKKGDDVFVKGSTVKKMVNEGIDEDIKKLDEDIEKEKDPKKKADLVKEKKEKKAGKLKVNSFLGKIDKIKKKGNVISFDLVSGAKEAKLEGEKPVFLNAKSKITITKSTATQLSLDLSGVTAGPGGVADLEKVVITNTEYKIFVNKPWPMDDGWDVEKF
jgi:RHS repeat-associated protein